MMNRYKKGELVIINGIGKLHSEENSNVIGIIKEKDYFFNEYLYDRKIFLIFFVRLLSLPVTVL